METLHILIRVSTQSQEEDGTSLRTQKQLGIDLSRRLKMKYQVHNEGGTSSSKDTLDNRPVMLNLLRLMDEGIVKHLFVYNTDRLSRGYTWYIIRKKMVDNNVILYCSTGRFNTSGSMETLILGILSEISQYDNKVRTERSRLGKLEKVKLNYYRGGPPTFGYKIQKGQRGSTLEIDEFEGQIVRSVFKMYHKGHSVKEIKQVLEKDGVRTRRGNKHWSLGSLQLMLRNDTYIGIEEYHDKKSGVTIRSEVPPIIPVRLFEEVQQRRVRILTRKGQFNRTTHEYLFRDFMYCQCGSPIGGRIKPSKSIRQFFCTLSERKFNKSKPTSKTCEMKRCVNIDKTEELLWDTIYSQLIKTSEMRLILKKTIKENPSFSSRVRKQKGKIKDELNQKEKELKKISDGIIDIERRRILNEFQSEDLYKGIKKELDKEYRNCHIQIENLKNSLRYYGEQENWFKTLEHLSTTLKSTSILTPEFKRSVLDSILDKVILYHDSQTLLHTLKINLKIPLLTKTTWGDSNSAPDSTVLKPLKTLGDQLQTRSLYSTVTDFARFLG